MSLHAEVIEFARSNDHLTEPEVARLFISRMFAVDLRRIASDLLSQWVRKARREKQLEIERKAARMRAACEGQNELAEPVTRSARGSRSYQDAFDDPIEAYRHAFFSSQKTRRSFIRFCGDSFDEWKTRTRVLIEELRSDGDDPAPCFDADWHPGGDRGWRLDQLQPDLVRHIEEYATHIRLELTAELLGSEFALGDGRRVTWGDATVTDHDQRISMLIANASANAEAAARHRAAVMLIESLGVQSLGEIR
jgi:hypothetical protein